jgi:enoyl-CoA hydratase
MMHLDRNGAVAIVRMEHNQGNLFNIDMIDALEERLSEVLESDAGALIITGNGATFVDGGDLVALVEGGPPYIRVFIRKFARLLRRIFTYPMPVIAAINGSAMTSGYAFAAACDMRLMTTAAGAKVAVQALNFGVPLEPTPLEVIRFGVAPHVVQYLMYTAKEMSPAEALELGLVDELVQPGNFVSRALEVAQHLAGVPNEAFMTTKQQLRRAALEQLDRYEAELAQRVIRQWTDPKTLAVWGSIVEQLKKQQVGGK